MNHFSTRNLPLAAAITTNKKLKLDHIEWDEKRSFGEFVFADPNCEGLQLEAQFLAGDALVDPNNFYRSLRTLRGMIESAKQRADFRRNDNDYTYASYR